MNPATYSIAIPSLGCRLLESTLRRVHGVTEAVDARIIFRTNLYDHARRVIACHEGAHAGVQCNDFVLWSVIEVVVEMGAVVVYIWRVFITIFFGGGVIGIGEEEGNEARSTGGKQGGKKVCHARVRSISLSLSLYLSLFRRKVFSCWPFCRFGKRERVWSRWVQEERRRCRLGELSPDRVRRHHHRRGCLLHWCHLASSSSSL